MSAAFSSPEAAEEAMTRLGIDLGALDPATAVPAGMIWRSCRARGGARQGVMADSA